MEPRRTIGIVGGGQLALMMAEAAAPLGLRIECLVGGPDDPVVRVVPQAQVGSARDLTDLRRLAQRCDALTFDHELVDPVGLAVLEDEGVVLRPGATALAVAIDKHRQMRVLRGLGLPVPETVVAHSLDEALDAVAAFGGEAVLKVATGGYDGRGVLLDASAASVRSWFPITPTTVLVQPRLAIDHELATQVVRGADGEIVVYPVVRTVQQDGMCAVVQVPSEIESDIEQESVRIATAIAEAIGVVGVLAVEFFVADGRLLFNEIAARPHNSGHVTIESSRTSQFENHLRAVAGLPLGATDLVVPAAAMVNVIGGREASLGSTPLPADVAVHLYGKTPRPGRKLGHVTSIAETTDDAVERAVRAARALEQGAVAS